MSHVAFRVQTVELESEAELNCMDIESFGTNRSFKTENWTVLSHCH
jgi:hypothetical protein